MVIAVTRATAADAPERAVGSWYLDYYTYDATGKATVSTHLITGHVHTHPPGANQNIPSAHDKAFYASPNWQGIPKYILNSTNMIEYDNSTTRVKNTQTFNCP